VSSVERGRAQMLASSMPQRRRPKADISPSPPGSVFALVFINAGL
jgi:hypothetical protein